METKRSQAIINNNLTYCQRLIYLKLFYYHAVNSYSDIFMYQYLLCVNGNTEYSDFMIELSHIDVLQVMKTQRINWAVFLRERMR